MALKDALDTFTKHNPRKQLLAKNFNEAFLPLAKAILSGYFEVSNGSTPVKFIRPTKVEFYYHEEYANFKDIKIKGIEEALSQLYNDTPIDENLLIKDFIVYHRNRPKHDPVDLFLEPGILNNHTSGIDITFEHQIEVNGSPVNVRASALIRGYYVYDKLKDCTEGKLLLDKDNKTQYADDRSTYLYDHLYGTSSVLNGISVRWKDNENSEIKDIATAPRTNVYQYVSNDKWTKENASKDDDFAIKRVKAGEPSTSKKYVPDKRKLQFFNPTFYR